MAIVHDLQVTRGQQIMETQSRTSKMRSRIPRTFLVLAVVALVSVLSVISQHSTLFPMNRQKRKQWLPQMDRLLRNKSETVEIAVLEDDPCSARGPPPGEGGSLGTLYVVAGTPEFAKRAFFPVVEHLRSTLGIPDANKRAGEDRPRWALATEPHLCRGILQDVLPFFDIVMTNTDLPRGFRNPTLKEEKSIATLASTDHRRRLTTRWVGMSSKAERDDSILRGWALAFKVHALTNSPFKKTIFLDVDSIPCSPNFMQPLAEDLGDGDISLQPRVREIYNVTGREHWIRGKKDTNVHTTACVVLNMESQNTRELLQKWKELLFKGSELPRNDQPALGLAMLRMWEARRLNHVDMDNSLFCRHKSWQEGSDHWFQTNPTCGGSDNTCVVGHKMDLSQQTNGTSLGMLKIPKTAGRSMKLDCLFMSVNVETCLTNLTSFGNIEQLVTMVRSPREHVISQYMHCRYSPFNKNKPLPDNMLGSDKPSNSSESLISGFDAWLSHMLDPSNQFLMIQDSHSCYTPWNLQSRMLTCNIRAPNYKGAQIIRSRYPGTTGMQRLPKEPSWNSVETTIRNLTFVGLTERYSESVCAFHWLRRRMMPQKCGCQASKQDWHHESHGVPHLLMVDMLPASIIAKIDKLTRVDKVAYELAEQLFEEKLSVIEKESGIKIRCNRDNE